MWLSTFQHATLVPVFRCRRIKTVELAVEKGRDAINWIQLDTGKGELERGELTKPDRALWRLLLENNFHAFRVMRGIEVDCGDWRAV